MITVYMTVLGIVIGMAAAILCDYAAEKTIQYEERWKDE